ncbi:MAG: GntR family transcriptional regulator [Dehalobacterium sp.]
MSTTLNIKKKSKVKNMNTIAYEAIKNSIIQNEIKPGEHISEYMLSEGLGMSRTPIREALKVLASEGLVEIYRGVGVFVKSVTAKEVYEIIEVRAALECTALHSAIVNITDEEIEQTENDWLKLKDYLEKGQEIDSKIIAEHDSKLHQLIVDKCDNSFLQRIFKGIRETILRYQYLSVLGLGDKDDSINQHLEIINLIRSRNLEKLLPVLENHIKDTINLIEEGYGKTLLT